MVKNNAIFKAKDGPANCVLCHFSKGDKEKVLQQLKGSISEVNQHFPMPGLLILLNSSVINIQRSHMKSTFLCELPNQLIQTQLNH